MKIAIINGSLSQQSINGHIANFIALQFPADVSSHKVTISDLPLYTQDLDSQSIPSYDRVRTEIKEADAVLIVTPEHNRSMPAALKNVIDIGSRPYGQGAWTNKKVAVVTASPGTFGGLICSLQVRQSLQMLNANILQAPEVCLGRFNAVDEQGNITDERSANFLKQFAHTFIDWVKKA